jgi:hypothetical protein
MCTVEMVSWHTRSQPELLPGILFVVPTSLLEGEQRQRTGSENRVVK